MARKTAVILIFLGYVASVASGSLGMYLCVTEDGSLRYETVMDGRCVRASAVPDAADSANLVGGCGKCGDYLLSPGDALGNRIEDRDLSDVTPLAVLPQSFVLESNNHQSPPPVISSPGSLVPITSVVLTI